MDTVIRAIPLLIGALAPAVLALADTQAAAPPQPNPWTPIGQIQHPGLTEVSGIVASRQHPGIFWVHNDSGHTAVLYAIRLTGEVVAEIPVQGASNIDWEDIAIDSDGFLYIADTGNNFGMFPVRSVYKVAEPDPFASPVANARVVERWKFKYAGKRYDIEALFVRDGQPWMISKSLRGDAALFHLEAGKGDKYILTQVAPMPRTVVNGADLSPDGRRLAVCSGATAQVFEVSEDGLPRADTTVLRVRFPSAETEAVCFDGEDLIVASEGGAIYRVTAEDLAVGTRFTLPVREEE